MGITLIKEGEESQYLTDSEFIKYCNAGNCSEEKKQYCWCLQDTVICSKSYEENKCQ